MRNLVALAPLNGDYVAVCTKLLEGRFTAHHSCTTLDGGMLDSNDDRTNSVVNDEFTKNERRRLLDHAAGGHCFRVIHISHALYP